MPRKSTASTTAAADANGDVSMVSNATNASTHAHPKSSRQSGGGKQDDGVSLDVSWERCLSATHTFQTPYHPNERRFVSRKLTRAMSLVPTQDLLLPRTLISRLARGVLPPNTAIQKDATLALAKSATVFISYLAHHANEQTTKKTIGPQDVLKALREIEMAGVMDLGAVGTDGRLGGRLEREMEAHEEILKGKRKGYRDKVKARESAGGDGAGEEDEGDGVERGEPSSKKARRMSEEDMDEEERMLNAQLNGPSAEDDSFMNTTGTARINGSTSSPALNGKARAVTDDESDVEDGDEEEDGEDEDEDEDEDDEEEEDDDDEHDGNEDGREANDLDDPDETRGPNGTGRIALMPDGNVEIASEDESD